MERTVIINENTKSINRLLDKYSEIEIPSHIKKIRGSFKITRYRQYEFHIEIEIDLKGEVFGQYGLFDDSRWYTSEIYYQKSFSKIRITKFIKMCLFSEIRSHCKYFGINIVAPVEITKINWV